MADGDVELRDYAAVLMDLPGAHLDATVKLNELVAAVRDTRKGGVLTVKLKVTVGKLDESTIEIQPDVILSAPKQPLRGGVFFPDENNNPSKDDPSQLWRGDDIRSAPTFSDATDDVKEAPKV